MLGQIDLAHAAAAEHLPQAILPQLFGDERFLSQCTNRPDAKRARRHGDRHDEKVLDEGAVEAVIVHQGRKLR